MNREHLDSLRLQRTADSGQKTDSCFNQFSYKFFPLFDPSGFRRGISHALGFLFTLGVSAILAVAVTGTMNTFTNGAVMDASSLNTNFSTLKTAVESITSSQWTSSGTSIYYNAGNVGIGTTSPTNKLEIASGGITLPYSTDNSSSIKFIASGGSPWNVLGIKDAGNVYLRTIDNGINSGIVFQDSAATDRVKIQNDGKVGIGTTSPALPLHIDAAIGQLRISNSANTTSRIDIRGGTDGGLTSTIYLYNPSSQLATVIGDGVGNSYYAAFGTGRLGIGTNAPSYRLDVSDTSAAITMRLTGSGGACTHQPTAGSETVACSSDEKLKKNIRDSKPALDELLKFQIKDYEIKSTGASATGVIAQEVQKTFPELVHKDEKGILLVEQVNPWKMLKAIQELKSLYNHEKSLSSDLSLRLRSATERLTVIKRSRNAATDENARKDALNASLTEQVKSLTEKAKQQDRASQQMEARLRAIETMQIANAAGTANVQAGKR